MATPGKVQEVQNLRAELSGMTTAVLTEYRGLTVAQLGELRKKLRAVSAEYRVVKNRLARRAMEGSPFDGLAPHLKGPTGLVLSEQDPVTLAKTLQAFARSNALLQVKMGLVEGRLVQPAELRAMADLPSREVLLGQAVGALGAPLASLVGALEGMLRSLVSLLEQIRARKAGEAS